MNKFGMSLLEDLKDCIETLANGEIVSPSCLHQHPCMKDLQKSFLNEIYPGTAVMAHCEGGCKERWLDTALSSHKTKVGRKSICKNCVNARKKNSHNILPFSSENDMDPYSTANPDDLDESSFLCRSNDDFSCLLLPKNI